MKADDFEHDHDEPGRLTIGCPGCVERVRLDQDIAAATDGELPKRRPTNDTQIAAVVRAWDLKWDATVVRLMRWCDLHGVGDEMQLDAVLKAAEIERKGKTLWG